MKILQKSLIPIAVLTGCLCFAQEGFLTNAITELKAIVQSHEPVKRNAVVRTVKGSEDLAREIATALDQGGWRVSGPKIVPALEVGVRIVVKEGAEDDSNEKAANVLVKELSKGGIATGLGSNLIAQKVNVLRDKIMEGTLVILVGE